MNPFIVLEGVDGSGKTTVGKALAERINGLYLRTPSDEYRPIRSYVDNGTLPEAKLLFYLSSVFDASRKIKDGLVEGPVICDRYIWSSLIPHSVYYSEDLEGLERTFDPITNRLVQPHTTVLLEVSEDEQIERLGLREGAKSASDEFCLDQELRRGVQTLFEEIAIREGWLRVNTTNRTVERVVKELQGGLMSLK